MVYIIIACAVIMVISLIVGLVKGYSRTKTWTTEYFFAAFFSVLIFSLVKMENNTSRACLVLAVTVALLLVFAFTSKQIKKFFNKKTAASRKRCYYESYGEREEHFLEIIDALELNDKKTYKKLTSRRMNEKSGGAGVADRIFGGLNLAFKAAVICTVTIVVTLLVLQFTQLSIVLEDGALYGVYTSGVWQFISPYIFDFILVGILQFAIRAGYRAGIINSLWILFIIALICGCGYVSYHLVFKTEVFASLSQSLSEVSFIASAGDLASSIISSFTALNIAKLIITAGLFIIGFIIILVFGFIMSGVLNRAREDKFVGTVDGFIGSCIFTCIAIAILLFAGMLLYSFSGFDFMELFNSYCYTVENGSTTWSAALFSSIYDCNPLNGIQVFANLQSTISEFFGY